MDDGFHTRVMMNLERKLLNELIDFESSGSLEFFGVNEIREHFHALSRRFSQLDITQYASDEILNILGYKRNLRSVTYM